MADEWVWCDEGVHEPVGRSLEQLQLPVLEGHALGITSISAMMNLENNFVFDYDGQSSSLNMSILYLG